MKNNKLRESLQSVAPDDGQRRKMWREIRSGRERRLKRRQMIRICANAAACLLIAASAVAAVSLGWLPESGGNPVASPLAPTPSATPDGSSRDPIDPSAAPPEQLGNPAVSEIRVYHWGKGRRLRLTEDVAEEFYREWLGLWEALRVLLYTADYQAASVSTEEVNRKKMTWDGVEFVLQEPLAEYGFSRFFLCFSDLSRFGTAPPELFLYHQGSYETIPYEPEQTALYSLLRALVYDIPSDALDGNREASLPFHGVSDPLEFLGQPADYVNSLPSLVHLNCYVNNGKGVFFYAALTTDHQLVFHIAPNLNRVLFPEEILDISYLVVDAATLCREAASAWQESERRPIIIMGEPEFLQKPEYAAQAAEWRAVREFLENLGCEVVL